VFFRNTLPDKTFAGLRIIWFDFIKNTTNEFFYPKIFVGSCDEMFTRDLCLINRYRVIFDVIFKDSIFNLCFHIIFQKN